MNRVIRGSAGRWLLYWSFIRRFFRFWGFTPLPVAIRMGSDCSPQHQAAQQLQPHIAMYLSVPQYLYTSKSNLNQLHFSRERQLMRKRLEIDWHSKAKKHDALKGRGGECFLCFLLEKVLMLPAQRVRETDGNRPIIKKKLTFLATFTSTILHTKCSAPCHGNFSYWSIWRNDSQFHHEIRNYAWLMRPGWPFEDFQVNPSCQGCGGEAKEPPLAFAALRSLTYSFTGPFNFSLNSVFKWPL